MIRRVLLFAAAAATALSLAPVAPAEAATVPLPGRITAVTARPGPADGEVTFSWKHDHSHTTDYRIETGLTAFSPYGHGLPRHGRHTQYFYVRPGANSVTLTAQQLAAAGARLASAKHIYYRLQARNRTARGMVARDWPYLDSVAVRPRRAPTTGTPLRVADFNVRSSMDSTGSAPSWLQRVPVLAKTILSRNPGVVTLQELGTGRADGKPGWTVGHTAQTTSLVSALGAQGGGRYRLVRTTRYSLPGVTPGVQGARILYDSARYDVVSHCTDTTGGGTYSSSCAFVTPYRLGEISHRRWAAYAILRDRASGKRFLVVSVHLDPRHSASSSGERSFEQLRVDQVKAAMAKVNQLNTNRLPVVLGGDLNGGQNCRGVPRAHDALVSGGYFDTAAAQTQVNVRNSTFNGFTRQLTQNVSGWACRMDVISVKGIDAATRFENVLKWTDANRPSDHNMIVADVRLP